MTGVFGGNKAKEEAKRAAERAKAEQAVANDRQLAELRAKDQSIEATRRAPRGRRLFVADPAGKGTLA